MAISKDRKFNGARGVTPSPADVVNGRFCVEFAEKPSRAAAGPPAPGVNRLLATDVIGGRIAASCQYAYQAMR